MTKFLRRGYAPLTLCRTCGHRIDCPQCYLRAWLDSLPKPPADLRLTVEIDP